MRYKIIKYNDPEDRPDIYPAFMKSKSNFIKNGDDYAAFYDGIFRVKDYHGPN